MNRLPPTVELRQTELDKLLELVGLLKTATPLLSSSGDGQHNSAAAHVDPEDEEILDVAERFSRKFSALWKGDTSGHGGDDSRADLALCDVLAYFTGPDPATIDRLFRQSGLMRPKWDERRGERTYGQLTIAKALEGRSAFFDWHRYRQRQARAVGTQPKPGPDLDDGRGDAWEGPDPDRRAREHYEREARGSATGAAERQAPRFRIKLMSSAEFFRAEYRQEWHVNNVLVKGQPAILGGPKKSLKTTLMVDLALSLGTGTAFLNYFVVPCSCRVALLSGESGEATLQETGRRIARAKGINPEEANIVWGFQLPQLADPTHLDALRQALQEHTVEVLLFDPLYLALLSGIGRDGPQASNLFQMGPLLLSVARACLDVGCTPVLAHHFKQRPNPFDEPQLEDLAFAGVGEFARQWILTARRQRYAPGSGRHDLWLAAGGSAGHSGGWTLAIDEGTVDESFGRKWEVAVTPAGETRLSEHQAKQTAKREQQTKQDQDDDSAVAAALDKLGPDGTGASYNSVQTEARLSDARMQRAVTRLREAQVLVECKVVVSAGNGAQRPARGLRRT